MKILYLDYCDPCYFSGFENDRVIYCEVHVGMTLGDIKEYCLDETNVQHIDILCECADDVWDAYISAINEFFKGHDMTKSFDSSLEELQKLEEDTGETGYIEYSVLHLGIDVNN